MTVTVLYKGNVDDVYEDVMWLETRAQSVRLHYRVASKIFNAEIVLDADTKIQIEQ